MGTYIGKKKHFKKPMKEGIELLNAIQDVTSQKDITIA